MSESAQPAPVMVRRAKHAGASYDATIQACSAVIAHGGLDHIAHFTSGIFDFAIDPPEGGDQDAPDSGPAALDRAGERLNLAVTRLAAACQPLDSGPLIRVVVQGESGALFQYLKLAGQNLFGLVLDGRPTAVERADRQMAQVTEMAASRMGAESLNWGGFRSRAESGQLWQAYQSVPSPRSADSPHIERGGDVMPEAAASACQSALHPDDLHYVGVYRNGLLTWAADIFDDPALATFFQTVTPQLRRSACAELVRQVQLQSRRFAQLLEVARSEQLTRLVLDVARGAVYIFPLSGEHWLAGMTMNQKQVERTDQRLGALRARTLELGLAPSSFTPTTQPAG
jgi:hypothetical protein